MTSTIMVNNIQNQCGANIINESSIYNNYQASGDTIALASGASQTGFGRSVLWIPNKQLQKQLLLQLQMEKDIS